MNQITKLGSETHLPCRVDCTLVLTLLLNPGTLLKELSRLDLGNTLFLLTIAPLASIAVIAASTSESSRSPSTSSGVGRRSANRDCVNGDACGRGFETDREEAPGVIALDSEVSERGARPADTKSCLGSSRPGLRILLLSQSNMRRERREISHLGRQDKRLVAGSFTHV